MIKKFNRILHNPIFIITAVYALAHAFLLILSGCWWDDWTFMSHNLAYINAVAMESGRPEWNLLIPFCWSQPHNGRILIFFLYYLDVLFVFIALKNSTLLSEKESLLISLFFAVFPVNDARLLISNFSYTVGLFIFYLTFMLFVLWNNRDDKSKGRIWRIPLLVLFFTSFILNSLLVFYYILFVYLFVLDIQKNKEKRILHKVFGSALNVLKNYPDFFILPFIYYGFNKTFFPTYGDTFNEYNAVTFTGLIKGFLYIPLSVVSLFFDVLRKSVLSIKPITLIIIAVFIFVIWKNDHENDDKVDRLRLLAIGVTGILVLIAGLFAYVMVRAGTLTPTGVKGRDAILTPLGSALMVFACLSCFKVKLRKMLTVMLIILGIGACGDLYLEWQKDYYYQLSMENLFANDIIKKNDTFFLIDLSESEIEGQRYYSLNANANHVYGDEIRLFIPKASNLPLLEDRSSIEKAKNALDHAFMMKDYNPDDLYFDAVLDYSCYLSDEETLLLKYYEIFDPNEFQNRINNNGKLLITIVDDDFTINLLKEYEEGKISNDNDIKEFLIEYEGTMQ